MVRRSSSRSRPDDARPPVFEFCVHGRPILAQTANRSRILVWQQQVRAAAMAGWPTARPPFTVPVELRITHYVEWPVGDMDNLIKPIQDALQGIVYVDDGAVKDVSGNWRDIDAPFRVRYLARPLAEAFSDGRPFVHVRLWLAPEEEDLG